MVDKERNQNDSIKEVLEITSRMDERIKNISERQEVHEEKLEKIHEYCSSLSSRIMIMEKTGGRNVKRNLEEIELKLQKLNAKIEKLDFRLQSSEGFINKIVDLLFKLGFIMLAGYLLYKFGWQAPPN